MIWQPLETAPKDGTEILAWDGGERRILHWFPGHYPGDLRACWMTEEYISFEPTHWMPLPAPPEQN